MNFKEIFLYFGKAILFGLIMAAVFLLITNKLPSHSSFFQDKKHLQSFHLLKRSAEQRQR